MRGSIPQLCCGRPAGRTAVVRIAADNPQVIAALDRAMSEPNTETDSPITVEPEATRHPWRDLPAERFQLVRLAPQPTDRSGARPLRFVELSEVERHSREMSLLRMTVRLPGQLVSGGRNVLEVWADHRTRELRFGPDSGLQVEPGNRGLGRLLLARGAHWARKRWGAYSLEGGALSGATSEDAQALRDHVLKAQGFDVQVAEANPASARYGAAAAGALKTEWNRDRADLVSLVDVAAMLEQADRNLAAQEGEIRQLKERIGRLQREDGTLRFTVACLIALALFQAGLLIWIATR